MAKPLPASRPNKPSPVEWALLVFLATLVIACGLVGTGIV